MKVALKISMMAIALIGGMTTTYAQTQNNTQQQMVDASKLPGVWDCVVTLPINSSGTTRIIHGHATYSPNGTVVHEDRITQIPKEGQPIEVNLIGVSSWRFDKGTNLLYETLRSVSLRFDKTNPQIAMEGVAMDKSYQAAIGTQMASKVIKLNDNEWTTLAGKPSSPLAVACQRGKNTP